MMKILVPNTIQVAGFDYSIRFVKHDKELTARLRFGECCNTFREMTVAAQFSQQQTNQTFIHELVEAINSVYLDEELTHRQIVNLSYGLHQVTEQLQLNFTQEDDSNENL